MLYDPATVEACAKVAEQERFLKPPRDTSLLTYQDGFVRGCYAAASAIRSLTAGREEGVFSRMAHEKPAVLPADAAETVNFQTAREIETERKAAKVADPVVRQDCAPAGADTYDAMAAIQSGVMKVVHPSPSQPVAGLFDAQPNIGAETSEPSLRQIVRGYYLLANVGPTWADDRTREYFAELARLTSSPVSEEELAGVVYRAYPGLVFLTTDAVAIARALLSQFSIGRK